MIHLVPPTGLGHVLATADTPVGDLAADIDGPGRTGLSEFRNYLMPGHRTHVATIDGPATITLSSRGTVVATATFTTTPLRRRTRENRPSRFGSPW